MSDVEIQSIFADNGPVEELELDEELEHHLIERGITEKHIVSFVEILEVLQGMLSIPPPPLTAVFPLNVQLLTVGLLLSLYIPAPESSGKPPPLALPKCAVAESLVQ